MAIPKPEPRDWQIANARELQVTDREVLAMLRAASREVNAQLKKLDAKGQTETMRRAQLEKSRSQLLAKQADVFTRLGDIVAARRASSAARASGLSAASDAALLRTVGQGAAGEALYEAALSVSQRSIDAALARMRLSALPLSQRIYRTQVWMGGRLSTLINTAIASGANAQEFAKKARDWFNPNTPGGVRYAAMRLARTEINNAFHAISAEKYAAKPWVTGVDWNLSKSHPKPDICNKVAADSPFPKDEVPARPHPQCMCYITEKAVDEDDFVEGFLRGDYNDYIDKELEKAGYEPPAEPAPSKKSQAPLPKTQQRALSIFRNGTTRDEWQSAGANANAIDALLRKKIVMLTGETKTLYTGKGEPYQAKTYRLTNSLNVQEPLPSPILRGQAAHDVVPKGIFKKGTLTKKQSDELKKYESGWGVIINQWLRRGSVVEDSIDKQTQKTVEALDKAMEGSRIPVPIEAYRGMFGSGVIFGDRLDGDLAGFEWSDNAFISTTTDRSIVDNFSQEFGGPDKESILLTIRVASGMNALETSSPTEGASPAGAVSEITLQRNTNWRVVKDNGYDDRGVRQLEVEVDPADGEVDAATAPPAEDETGAGTSGPPVLDLQAELLRRGLSLPEPPRSSPEADLIRSVLQDQDSGFKNDATKLVSDRMLYSDEKTRTEVTAKNSYMNNHSELGRSISANFSIDREGKAAGGSAERIFYLEDGKLQVRHEYMRLPSTFRGAGFGARWNAKAEEFYRSLGVETIHLTANIDVGGYAWAKQGYDFKDDGQARNLAGLLERELAEFPPAVQDAARSLIARARGEGKRPLPLEFAMLGWSEGAELWPGKKFLLGKEWKGVKKL